MTVIVKLTSGEDKADQNVSKGFELIPIAAGMRVAFIRDEEGKGWLNVHGNDEQGEEHLMMVLPVLGNAYIMDAGKTVASFSSADIPDIKQPDPLDYYRGQSNNPDEPVSVRTSGGVSITGDVTIQGSLSELGSDSYPEDITDPTDERLSNADRHRVDGTYKTISLILSGESMLPHNSEEHIFAMGLAAAIESFRAMKSKYRPTISLAYTGSVVCPREKLNKLQDHFRLVELPVSLCVESNDNNFITEYSIANYCNQYDVDEADTLLLRNLRNQQSGLVKNMIDKIIKYYKAGVSVVPLEPATLVTDTQREQIKHTLYNVLGCHFNFIIADKEDTGDNPAFGDMLGKDSSLYTHIVIRFIR